MSGSCGVVVFGAGPGFGDCAEDRDAMTATITKRTDNVTQRRVIAEIGSCGGDLQLAIDTAQAAIEAGAWLVKGQMFRADTLTTRTAEPYGQGILEPATQYEAFTNALSYEEWGKVAETVGFSKFAASVFDLEACKDYPFEWIKTASADINYRALLEAAAATEANLIVSTGAANAEEIAEAWGWVDWAWPPVLLACTLCYPTQLKDAHVGRVETLQGLYGEYVGYSDHTRGIAAADLAFRLGAWCVEKHFTIQPGTGGDNDFAITPDQLTSLVAGFDVDSTVEKHFLYGDPGLYVRDCERPARERARRALHAAVDIPAGTVIGADMISVVRPWDGLEPRYLSNVIGTVQHQDLKAGDPIR